MATVPTVALKERIEFGTDAWVRELETHLRKAELPETTRFRHSVLLQDAPPHLSEASDSSIGYAFDIVDGRVTVNSVICAANDVAAILDYNRAQLLATTVLGTNHHAAERRLRDARRLAQSALPIPFDAPNLDEHSRSVLRDAHHHMALRTIPNPDVVQRARGLGLAQNLAELDDRGYTVLRDAFSDEFADELREEAHRNHDAAPPDVGFRATMLLKRGHHWEEAVIHPWVLALADYMLGRGCLIYQSDTIIKGPGLDTHPGLHADYGASRVAEPFPEYCVEATAVWAIDDFDAPAGPTVIVPGSFRNRRQVPPGMTREDGVLIEMPKGSIAFWHGASWHGAMPREREGKRTSLHNAYCRFFMRPLERYDDIDQAIVDRNPPIFSTLCGLDDAFGKSGYHGADFERMRYSAEARYGSTAF
ncbi:MAG: phytanoyl-CoA dioxygenase family protein [Gammaproteobacteria bacterium]|nr:phytanoyl-CoA dioxygenase family protein [Gammaproteobacteria bacterium]